MAKGRSDVSLNQVTPPNNEPLSLSDAKTYLRIDHSAEDGEIENMIGAARRKVERDTRRSLITQTWEMVWDYAPARQVELWRPPLQTVNKIESTDDDGNTSTYTASNYLVDSKSTPGRVQLKDGNTWPSDLQEINALTIEYDAGYGTSGSDVPEGLIQALKRKLADLYEHRLGQLPEDFSDDTQPYDHLVAQYRVHYL